MLLKMPIESTGVPLVWSFIVQGALRLAAHQALGERPHFGGKYSTRLIESGINAVKTAFSPRSKTIL
jgi:hypothetical protein